MKFISIASFTLLASSVSFAGNAVTGNLNSLIVCNYSDYQNAQETCEKDAATASQLSSATVKLSISCRQLTDQEAQQNEASSLYCVMEQGNVVVITN